MKLNNYLLKRFSYCNNSMVFKKNKETAGFLLIEALTALVVLIGMISVILMATAYAVNYAARARMMHGAVRLASTVLDEALYTRKISQAPMDGYTIQTQEIAPQHYRVTVSWLIKRRQAFVVLEGAAASKERVVL